LFFIFFTSHIFITASPVEPFLIASVINILINSVEQVLLEIQTVAHTVITVHKSPPQVSLLSHMITVHNFTSDFSKIHFILSSHLLLNLPRDLFPSGFPIEI
jgi:hypothetical protein